MGNCHAKDTSVDEDISVRNGLTIENRKFSFGTVRVVKRLDGKVVGWLNCNENFIKAN